MVDPRVEIKTDLSNRPRSGRPITILNEDKVKQVDTHIPAVSKKTLFQVSECVQMSHSSAYILAPSPHYSNIQIGSKMLRDSIKERRLIAAQDVLEL